MAFHYLGYLPQLGHNTVETGRVFKVQSYVSAGLVTYFLRVDDKLGAFKYSQIC